MYKIELNGIQIGTTKLEFADVPMGVVFGKIEFINIEKPYSFLKNYCFENKVKLNDDYPKDKFINTMVIPELKVYLKNGKELKGWGAYIIGMEKDDFEIQIGGIESEIMKTEFKHHYNEYFKNE